MAAVLVAHVPHGERGMLGVSLRHLLDQVLGSEPVARAAGAVVLARAVRQADAIRQHREHLGVFVRQPWRGRGGGGGEVHCDASGVQEVHHPVEPPEVVLGGGRLEPRPRKDTQRDQVDARLLHETHVFVPHALRPLVRVVVAAVKHVRQAIA